MYLRDEKTLPMRSSVLAISTDAFLELTISQQAAILQCHVDYVKKKRKMHDEFTRDLIAKKYGMSGRSVSQKLRINYLNDTFKEQVDRKKLALKAAVELSYLDEENQKLVYERAVENEIKVSVTMAQRLKSIYEKGELDEDTIDQIMLHKKEEPKLESDLIAETS